jgi:hypothetical protein
MKVITNGQLVQSKQRLAARLSVVGLVVLSVAFMMSLTASATIHPLLPILAWPVAIVGLLIAMVGTYYINRWVRPPLAPETLATTLKGLDNKHVLFNHVGPVPHLLVSPRGLFPLVVKRYDGSGSYADGQWKAQFSPRRFFGQGVTAERLGNPDAELEAAEAAVEQWLQTQLPDYAEQIPVAAVAVFINPRAQIDLGENPRPITNIEGLHKTLRRNFFPGVTEIPYDAYKAVLKALGAS